MVGQYFDNIWIYLKAVTDVNLANNNLDYGISRDLVYERLKSLGLHLYNTQAGESVAQYLVGSNTGSSTWDNNTTITGSYLNNIPRKDLVSELYKRIYHNLPLLLKQKGTVEGLDNLMTVFGIPNKTYYTVGSESFYFPTGSSVTSSILNVKEFGGSLKSNLTKGYNNDKVRIVSNTIVPGATGSVLSPILSLQTSPTSTTQFRDNDMNYIDISFSPQTQIDTYASKSIASNNPTWSLDDYIGDPRQQYSSSYPDLDTQRKLYYQTGVSGFPGFTGSLLDYNGFIRLIQYFDNSLFKMLEDFVPERTSLSTGVTINSPVLERNKVSYANPTTSTTQSVYDAEYSASTISSTYGNFYNALSSSNNTMGWYDGELSSSTVNIYQYFTDNYNPYLIGYTFPTTSFTTTNTNCATYTIDISGNNSGEVRILYVTCAGVPSTLTYRNRNAEDIITCASTIDDPYVFYNTNGATVTITQGSSCTATISASAPNTYEFQHTDWNVLLNNVSSSVLSTSRNTIEYLGDPIPENIISYPAELQDSYLSLKSYQTSRYEGSKVTSQLYNIHTDGDDSYGKAAAIDRYTRKIGLFTQIESSSYLPQRNTTRLKYLVDEFGGLTELNQQNNNWSEIQRTFMMSNTASVALFDNKKYSNQKATDGNKVIFDSGYTYVPIIYAASGSTKRLYFDNIGEAPIWNGQATFLSSSYYISGSSTLGYPLVNKVVTNLFNYVTKDPFNGTHSMKGGTPTSLPVYVVPEGGAYSISANLNLSITYNPGASGNNNGDITFALKLLKNGSSIIDLDSHKFTFTSPGSTYNTKASGFQSADGNNITITGTPVTSVRGMTVGGIYYPAGRTFYKFDYGFYESFGTSFCTPTTYLGACYSPNNNTSATNHLISCGGTYTHRVVESLYSIPDFSTQTNAQTFFYDFSVSYTGGRGGGNANLIKGDAISASFYINGSPTISNNFTASLSPTIFKVTALANTAGNYPYVQTDFIDIFDSSPSSSQLLLSSGVTSFYSPNYIFLPTYVSASYTYTSSLYNQYGDVDYPFQFSEYDMFVAYDYDNNYYEFRIIDTQIVPEPGTGKPALLITFDGDLSGALRDDLTGIDDSGRTYPGSTKFLFLKRLKDETNTYLTFKKRPGLTSYGFLLPNNLAPDIIKNIDTITKEVKTKLLADQQGTTTQ
jgi:hypothetical protein